METATEKREVSINLEALSGDFGSDSAIPTPVEEKKEEVKEEKDPNEQEVKTEEVKPEVNTEAKTEEKKEEKSETETKTEESILEFKPEDIEGYKPKAEDGTWKAVGELFEADVTEESPEALKAAIEAKYNAKIEEARKQGLEQEYSKLKPETVTALKLMEMGVPEDQAFNPTAKHQELLKLDDAALVRINLEGLGWDQERVDLEMESLSQNQALLKHEALKLKEFLNTDAQQILAKREALLQEYTQNKDKVAIQQKEQHLSQVKEAVMSAESFLGAKINSEAKSEIFQKYSRGDYGDIFKDGKSVAEYLLFKSFGHKILDEAKRGFYAQGKEEVTKKLLGIPPKNVGEASNKVVEKVADNNQKSKVEVLKSDFG